MLKCPGHRTVWLAAAVLTIPFQASLGNTDVKTESVDLIRDRVRSELSELTAGQGHPERALAGLAVAVLEGGQVRFEAAFGRAFIDPEGENDRALMPDSLMRVASISKTVCTVVAMQLVNEGLLDPDRDVSDYLGWTLRNPNYPDRPITLRQLLSHTSSIRDAGESYIIRHPRLLREAFDPGAPEYEARFQPADGAVDRGPGVFYEYSNLNFGVVGTLFEKVTGARFDQLMQQRFYQPLGLGGGFNVAAFTNAERERLATLYRKRDADGSWDSTGAWRPQVDDLSAGIPTQLPENPGYIPGNNGAHFSPQGGARLSLKGLERLALLLMGDGSVDGVRVLPPERMEEMRRAVWRYDPALQNMERYTGQLNARATGLRIITGITPGDRLFVDDDRHWYGHFGEAYGLLAGVWVQPESGQGVVYAITGTAFDPYEDADENTTLTPIEARVLEQLAVLLPQ